MPLVIRPMLITDLPAARTLWASAEGVEMAEGDSEAELSAYLARNPGLSHVVVAPGGTDGTLDHIVGAVLAGHDGRRGLLYHLAVDPAYQRTGAGTALATASLQALRAAGLRRVFILVAHENAKGRSFWLRRGWEPVDLAETLGFDL